MTQEQLLSLLADLLALPHETEWVEFKKAEKSFHFDDLGEYFSALCNEANLKNKECGWFILGVEDKTKKIIGTKFRDNKAKLDSLKQDVSEHTTSRITFLDIFELNHPEGRVLMFKIPPAPQGMPVSWKGHFYGRNGESKGALNIQEIEQIRNQTLHHDWSAGICEGAGIDDLDPEAIKKARLEYKNKNPKIAGEIDAWDDITFLNKAKVTINGKITRTAIILLGREESTHFIIPSQAVMTWILKDDKNIEKDYRHFSPPFILSIDKILAKIRNLTVRYLPEGTLFVIEVPQYDPYVIREILHNCIAHQDYSLCGRINIVERPDELLFTNLGSFIPGSIENVIKQDAPQELSRNPFLANAMVNLQMIDTIGSGIKRIFTLQRNRFFPLPDYYLEEPERVKVRLLGKIINENYTKILTKNTNLDLDTIIYLDKVQKKEKLTREEFKVLKSKELVEGRYPTVMVSAKIAKITGEEVKYTLNKGLDDEHYKSLILSHIKSFNSASRKDIENVIINKLPDIYDNEKKKNKVKNLIAEMSRKDKTIKNIGNNRNPKWVLNDI